MKAFFDLVEGFLVDLASRLAPWGAAAPTAWSVGFAAFKVLNFPWPVALSVGIAVESLGVSSVALALTLYSYNRVRRSGEPAAPLGLAVIPVALYFLVAVLLSVLVDVLPGVAQFAPAVFPLLGLVSYLVLGLRYDHAQRLVYVAGVRAQAEAERLAQVAKAEAERVAAAEKAERERVAAAEKAERERVEAREYRRSLREERQRMRVDASHSAHDADMRADASHDAPHSAYVCPVCGDEFQQSTRFAAHKRWAHRNGNGHHVDSDVESLAV